MKNFIKKLITVSLGFAIVLCTSLTLTACKDDTTPPQADASNQIVALSVNPSIEFIIDNNNKVVSVSASNEDGMYILEKFSSFSGMSVQEAALKFLELSEEYGFTVSGSATDENFTISISGDNAESLYSSIRSSVDSKLSELGITLLSLEKIDKSKLQDMVAEYYQELSSIEVATITESELIDLIKTSREETKDLATEDERLSYYRERAQKLVLSKVESILTFIEENPTLIPTTLQSYISSLTNRYNELTQLYTDLNNQIETLYSTETTGIDALLEEYITAKNAYFDAFEAYKTALETNADNIADLKTTMDSLKSTADTLKDSLENARESAKSQFDSLMTSSKIHAKISLLNTEIDFILQHLPLSLETINSTIQNELNNLKQQHKNAAQNPWESQVA